MNYKHIIGLLHLFAQILGQTAVQILVPDHYKAILTAVVAILGVTLAYLDRTYSTPSI